ncbi:MULTISPECIES: RDD family protein [Pseudomonas]|uniref:RDD family protein n=1 Tax=Pseudomonas TaxID=286 RepID=UPI001FF37278|nr:MULTISPECIES: RDD family protein [Pseudomonas]
MDVRQFVFLGQAGNGMPMLNIVAPNTPGLSHTMEGGCRTILWNESMDPWRPLDKVAEPCGVSPSPPGSSDPGRTSDTSASRWPRFFARIFDMCWELVLVAVVSGFLVGKYFPGIFDWAHKPGAAEVHYVLCLPVALILDALLYRIAGNTPCKALFRLKIETSDAKPLGFFQYLHRNSLVWASGLAFGLPIFNLLTMANQAFLLGSGRRASYDESLNFWVRSRPLSRVRKIASGIVFMGGLGGFSVLSSLSPTTQREWVQYLMQKNNYAWENPLTHLDASIEPWWEFSVKVNSDGQQVYVFSERVGGAQIVFAMQQTGDALDEYVHAFQKNTAANMRFSDRGRFFERAGRQYWQGYGRMVKDGRIRLKVEIVQSGSDFWRVVITQKSPYDYTDELVGKLQAELLSTVK